MASAEWLVDVPATVSGVYTVTAGLEGRSGTGEAWVREVTRTVVIGEDELAWRGVVRRVTGGVLTINRGARHGVRPGLLVYLGSAANPSGKGLVTAVYETTSEVEVNELFGSTDPSAGMAVELDRVDWMGDRRSPL
jgi:hypothetical protein